MTQGDLASMFRGVIAESMESRMGEMQGALAHRRVNWDASRASSARKQGALWVRNRANWAPSKAD